MSLDPVLQQLLAQVPTVPPGPIDYPTIRAQAAALLPMIAPVATRAEVKSVEDRKVVDGSVSVPLRIYRPVGDVTGILHFIHGGGWSVGDLDTIDPTARRLCAGLSMVVVASSYRLSPENPFPAGFEDSIAAARWVQSHRQELGGEHLPTVIGGDSAGGNLAAAIVIAMRDTAEQTFDVQLLLYPAVDLRPGAAEYPSRQRNADPTLRADDMSHYVDAYVGGADAADPRISPLAVTSVEGLPPALVVVQTVDPLRDEAIAYADRLRDAVVPVDVIEFGNLTHGFVHMAGLVPAAADATDEVMERLTKLVSAVA
ncbi:alpha/beta hydrolase [Sphingomonas sp. Ant20]|uniref:alpha/beta hydrolase n=1 Tax=Sphingomonas sp. Ant20 TaxID=104605 RepID=UPI00068CC18C|nr:alpha/beta hydrolase [Sphingomonas sp. Ant20]